MSFSGRIREGGVCADLMGTELEGMEVKLCLTLSSSTSLKFPPAVRSDAFRSGGLETAMCSCKEMMCKLMVRLNLSDGETLSADAGGT